MNRKILVLSLLFVMVMMLASTAHGADSVRMGDRGKHVTEVQYLLVSHGYVGVKVDGTFGPKTDRAVRAWQHVNGQTVDGVVGPGTWRSLQGNAPPPKGSPPAQRKVVPRTVEQIIRSVWPANLADEAVRIATRESRLIPTAKNAIAFGLFQIYYAVHASWLAGYGVHSSQDLLDPLKNTNVAYALYLKAGWQPWAL